MKKNELKNINKLSAFKKSSILGPITILIVIMLFLFITTPPFRQAYNITSLMLSAAVYVMVAMGASIVIIGGGIDLSLGSIVGLTGAACCLFIRMNVPLIPSIIGAVLVGGLCGAMNGFMVTVMGLIPFIATLGGMWIYRGILMILTNGQTIAVRAYASEETLNSFVKFGSGSILGIPIPAYVFIVVALLLSFILKKTVFGRNIYFIGSNPDAAAMSGINVPKVKFIAYIITGMLGGLAGAMLAGRLVSMPTNGGNGYEFEGIFASVLGGISMVGGEGGMLGAVVGAIIVACIRNGLNLNGIDAFWQQVILGIIIVMAVFYDTVRTKKARNAKS